MFSNKGNRLFVKYYETREITMFIAQQHKIYNENCIDGFIKIPYKSVNNEGDR